MKTSPVVKNGARSQATGLNTNSSASAIPRADDYRDQGKRISRVDLIPAMKFKRGKRQETRAGYKNTIVK